MVKFRSKSFRSGGSPRRTGWRNLGGNQMLRSEAGGVPFVTDGGHYILDCSFEKGPAIQSKAAQLHDTVGVVEHGMFLGMATEVHVGSATGVRVLRKGADIAHHQEQVKLVFAAWCFGLEISSPRLLDSYLCAALTVCGVSRTLPASPASNS